MFALKQRNNLPNRKTLLNFVLSWAKLSADILLDESVLAFILVQKSGKFHYHEESNTLVTLYWYMSLQGILFYPHAYIWYWCGGLFIRDKVFQNLCTDRLIDSTLSIFYLSHRSRYDANNLKYYEKTIISFCGCYPPIFVFNSSSCCICAAIVCASLKA